MSTGMRKWMEKDCPEIEYLSAQVLIDREDLDRLEAAEKERDALRAKIAEMEKQEPVGEIQRANSTGNYICSEVWVPLPVGAKLYALRGAQPAPSVPGGWQLVPTAESRHPGIYKMLGALHAADNTPGMSEWESYRAMLAAAPEAKP